MHFGTMFIEKTKRNHIVFEEIAIGLFLVIENHLGDKDVVIESPRDFAIEMLKTTTYNMRVDEEFGMLIVRLNGEIVQY